MMPHDLEYFTPTTSADWPVVDDEWFRVVARTDVLLPGEKVHVACLAIQRQWICDVEDSESKREFLEKQGLSYLTLDNNYLVVTGSLVLAQYDEFRMHKASLVEVGILYGYPPTAVLAFAGFLPQATLQPWPETPAEYFFGGIYSSDYVVAERELFAKQWAELRCRAPDVCRLAEDYYANAVRSPEALAEQDWAA